MSPGESLKEWIQAQMTLDKPDILLQVRDRVAAMLGVSKDGAVGFKLTSEALSKLSTQERILLYMIGKLYAQAAEYSRNDAVSNEELQRNLGMPEGTVRGQLTRLRRTGFVISISSGKHSIARNRVLESLSMIETKVGRVTA